MDFKSLINKGTEELCDLARGKMTECLGAYKKAITVLETFGFKVGKFSFGMGVVPEIHTAITGSIEDIDEAGLTKMIGEHQGEPLLVSLLKALIMTRHFYNQVELNLTGVTMNVTLSVPPNISVELH